MPNRPNIPDRVKIQIWTEAAGRCQFRGCNEPLWFNGLTLNQKNFGKLAHIIGASKDGPRGGELSEKMAQDAENIMLLCAKCHDEIDDGILRNLYPVEDLRAMKKEHADRVRMLLDQPSKRTRPLILKTQIGGQQSSFSERSIKSAILPDYPDRISSEWYKIEISSFDRSKASEWEAARSKVEREMEYVNRAAAAGDIPHLSIFALAPMPLLMFLGRMLGDKIPAQVFEPRRTDDQDRRWKWEEENGMSIQFKSSRVRKGKGKDALLLFALSDFLNVDKYEKMGFENPHVYQLTTDNPVQGFLTKKSEKANFIQASRALLNQIQKEVGKNCIVHVLPAMPASLAVEFGRLIQPTKDPQILVYEFMKDKTSMKILELLK